MEPFYLELHKQKMTDTSRTKYVCPILHDKAVKHLYYEGDIQISNLT